MLQFSLQLHKLAHSLQEEIIFSPTLETFLDSLNLTILRFLNRGSSGVVYEVLFEGKKSILKLTTDLEEIACAKKVFGQQLWKKTAHLPKVYLAGDLPKNSALISIWKEPVFGFYLRESITPFVAKSPQLPASLRKVVQKIEQQTGLHLTDIFPENFGKTEDGRIVYFDLSCR